MTDGNFFKVYAVADAPAGTVVATGRFRVDEVSRTPVTAAHYLVTDPPGLIHFFVSPDRE